MPNLSSIDIDFGGHLFWAFLLPALVVLVYLTYRRTNPPTSQVTRWILSLLRGTALCLLLLFLMELILALRISEKRKPSLALLVDRSESMSIVDGLGDRWKRVIDILKGEVLEDLDQRAELSSFQFADDFVPLALSEVDSLRIAGGGTDIANALNHTKAKLENPVGIILLSDGANNLGKNPEEEAKAIGVPIYTVGVGSSEEQKDIRISRVIANDLGYAGEEVPVEVTVQSWGYEGMRVPVVIREEGKELESKIIRLAGESREQTLLLHILPERPGLHRYKVSVPEVEEELLSENNEAMVLIDVLKSKLKVLLVAGGPCADLAFLRRSLSRDENLKVEPLVSKDGRSFYQGEFPSSGEVMNRFDLIVLVDLPRGVILGEREKLLADFVREGGGLLITGGRKALGGDYAGSPLADALPIRLGGRFRDGRFSLEISPSGRGHVITRLSDDPSESMRLWAELPPLLGWNENLGAKKGAIVLATHPTLTIGGEKLPLLVVGRYGRGKTMVVAFSSFWRLDLMMWGIGGTSQASEKFWNNAVRWLTIREETSPVKISTERQVYRGGERVVFDAQVYDELLRPQREAVVSVSISGEGKEEEVIQMRDLGNGRYRGEVGGLGAGEYRFRGKAFLGGREIGTDKGEFTVSGYSLEFEDTRMNRELLSRIAYKSGGRFYEAEDFGKLVEDLDLSGRRVERVRRIKLWNRAWALVAFLALVAVEWGVRRRRGMM